MLGLVFWLTFTIGTPLQDAMDAYLVAPLAGWAGGALSAAPFWLRGRVVDGVIGGVGSVLTFLPILVIFFAAFALLEDVGYMARAAYVMDNLMHLMGLHGKSFLPLFLGFGCNVPAVMGARVIDSWQARLLTILIAPLVPCTARMAVVAFIAPVFFGANAVWVTWGLVLLSLAALVLSGVLLNQVIFKGQRSAFIMEMPLYHIPNARTIGLLVWQRALSFVQKAGTAILAMAMLVWVLSFLPNGELNTSYLAQFGQLIEPVGRWMGLDWRLTVALITSFPAKENAIATLGVLFGNSPEAGLAATLASTFSTATALSFLAVTMLFIPCMATVAVTKQETNSWRWTLLSVFLLLGLSIGAGTIIYHLAAWMGL
jgi:ferrous iron transport protein B